MPDNLKMLSPAAGNWNLAHICTLLPESLSLFAIPAGCARVIMITAAERGILDRFAHLSLTREQLMMGETEQAIIDGTCELLDGLSKLPPAVMIFISCVDGFIGSDHEVYLSALRSRYPSVAFLDCAMDPINRETPMPPIVRMQVILSSLWRRTTGAKAVNFFGSFTPPDPNDDLVRHLRACGYDVRHLAWCKTFSQHVAMGESALNIVTHPSALTAAKALDMPFFYMPVCYEDQEVANQYKDVCKTLGIPSCTPAETDFSILRGRRIVISDSATWRPWSLAERLIAEGAIVTRIFAAEILPAEREAAARLDGIVETVGGTPVLLSDRAKYKDPEAIAIGHHAAFMTGTYHYLPIIAFGGDGRLPGLAAQVKEAVVTKQPADQYFEVARGCLI